MRVLLEGGNVSFDVLSSPRIRGRVSLVQRVVQGGSPREHLGLAEQNGKRLADIQAVD